MSAIAFTLASQKLHYQKCMILMKVVFSVGWQKYLIICFTQTIPVLEMIPESSCSLHKPEKNNLCRKERMSLTVNTLRIICRLNSTDILSENTLLQNPSILQKCQIHATAAVILESTFNYSNSLHELWGVF